MQKTTFIYALSHNDEIKYIGKANVPMRRFRVHLKDNSDCLKAKWVQQLLSNNQKPAIEIIDKVPLDEWIFWEQHYVSLYKSWGFDLVNADNGGVGSGQLTNEAKEKISKQHKGKKISDEQRQIIVESNKRRRMPEDHPLKLGYWEGRHRTEEDKKRKSESQKNIKKSKESVEKMRLALTGRKLSEEHKKKISPLGRKHSEETKEKMRLATAKRMMTNEAKEQIKNALKKRWDNYRQRQQQKQVLQK